MAILNVLLFFALKFICMIIEVSFSQFNPRSFPWDRCHIKWLIIEYDELNAPLIKNKDFPCPFKSHKLYLQFYLQRIFHFIENEASPKKKRQTNRVIKMFVFVSK